MVWTKGQSGNPGGQRRVVRDVIDAAQLEGVASVEALARIRDTSKDPHAVVAAAKALLDRGCGKPQVSIDVTHNNKRPETREEIEARIVELEQEIAETGTH